MQDLLPISLDDMIAEAEREIVLRNRVYPRWVSAGQIAPAKAERQLRVMKAIASELRRQRDMQAAAQR